MRNPLERTQANIDFAAGCSVHSAAAGSPRPRSACDRRWWQAPSKPWAETVKGVAPRWPRVTGSGCSFEHASVFSKCSKTAETRNGLLVIIKRSSITVALCHRPSARSSLKSDAAALIFSKRSISLHVSATL
jgi:hypothetical protein